MCQICRLRQRHDQMSVPPLLDMSQFSTLIVIDHRQDRQQPSLREDIYLNLPTNLDLQE